MAEPIDDIAEAIGRYRYNFQSEAELEAGIARGLTELGVAFERQVTIGAGAVIDLLAGAVGVEIKVEGGLGAITRQLFRYATSPMIAALILVTRRGAHRRAFPATMHGKPFRVVVIEGPL